MPIQLAGVLYCDAFAAAASASRGRAGNDLAPYFLVFNVRLISTVR